MADLTLPPPVQAVFDATNAGDTTAFLAAFAPNAVVDDWGREFHGRDAIKQWSDGENIGVHSTFEVTEVVSERGTYLVTANVGGGGFNGHPTNLPERLFDCNRNH